jgi:site-specific DNA-methyltransferase (adenine-specific)
MKNIPDKSIDFVLTDPPYGTTHCKWDNVIPFEPMWEQLKRITKDNGAIALFGIEPFSSHLRMSNIKMFKYDWIWQKAAPSNFAIAKHQPLKFHEIISVFSYKKHLYFPIKEDRTGSGKNRVLRNFKSDTTSGDFINNLKTNKNIY